MSVEATPVPAQPDQAEAEDVAKPVAPPEPSGHEMPPPQSAVEKKSLLAQAAAAKKGKPEETENERLIREEQELLRNITRQKALKGVNEIAKVRRFDIPENLIHGHLACCQ